MNKSNGVSWNGILPKMEFLNMSVGKGGNRMTESPYQVVANVNFGERKASYDLEAWPLLSM